MLQKGIYWTGLHGTGSHLRAWDLEPGSFSDYKGGCLSSPSVTLKAWHLPGKCLIRNPDQKSEETRVSCVASKPFSDSYRPHILVHSG